MTSTNYTNPYRPIPVRVFNCLSGTSQRSGLSKRLEVAALLDLAQRKTGLSDFGDNGHLCALEVLVESINAEARLTPTGRLIQKSRLVGALVHRLRIEDLLRRHPDIETVDLDKVVIVTGLQRTGTTLVQRLLNSLTGVAGISAAEALAPLAAVDLTQRSQRTRRQRAVLAEKTISYLAPEFMLIHQIYPEEPEEDVMLLDLDFMSQSAEAIMSVPTYSRWLESQDHSRPYEYFRRVLKVLCWQRPGSALVLKTPQHLEYLDVVLKVFPDAKIVQTHRDPQIALASFCSMVAHSRGVFSDYINPAEIGEHWFRKTRRMVHLAMQTRTAETSDRFLDVSYYDLLKNPIFELRRICELADINFNGEDQRKAKRHMEANPQNRFGKHNYRLADFGLREQVVDDAFSAYRQAYAIPFEKPANDD